MATLQAKFLVSNFLSGPGVVVHVDNQLERLSYKVFILTASLAGLLRAENQKHEQQRPEGKIHRITMKAFEAMANGCLPRSACMPRTQLQTVELAIRGLAEQARKAGATADVD